MVTPNKALDQPANGSFVNTWDQPLNNNMSIIDRAFGGVANIAISGGAVTLSQAQYQCAIIHLTGFLNADNPVIFPANVGGVWTIINECSNFLNAVPYCYTGIGNYIGIPPGQCQIVGDGVNFRYISLPPVGTYMQVASNAYPRWVLLNPVWPYLNCDGSAYNTSVYQRLAEYTQVGAVPDLRGRANYSSDAGTGRITGVIGGAQYYASGGDQWLQNHGHGYGGSTFINVNTSTSLQDINHTHGYLGPADGQNNSSFGGSSGIVRSTQGRTSDGPNFDLNAHQHNIQFSVGYGGGTDAGGTIGSQQNMPPIFVGGITLIRTGYP